MGPRLRFDVIGEAWRLYRQRCWTWSLAMLIVLIANSMVGSAIFSLFGGKWPGGPAGFRLPIGPGQGALQYLGVVAIGGYFLGGLIRMANQQVLGRAPRLEDLFSGPDVGFQVVAGAVFYGAATFVGSMLCAIPGLILSGLLMFTIPLIVIARRTAIDAVSESWRVLAPHWLSATIFHMVLALISGSGLLLCGVGLLFTGPLYSLSIALLFHDFYEPTGPTHHKKPPADDFPDF